MRTGSRTLLIAFAFLATLAAPANALEIFGNPSLTHAGMELPGGAGTPQAPFYDWLAQGFTMGSTSYDLASVQIGLFFPGAGSYGSISVGLYTDSGGSPNTAGSPIATFTSPTFSTDPEVYQFNYTGPTLSLAANSTYWLVVKNNGTGDLFSWYYAKDEVNDPPTPPAQIAPTAQNGSGVTYAGTKGYDTLAPGWFNFSSPQEGLRYSVNVVPEPSTYALGLAGTLVLGTIARRRNRLAVTA